MFLLESNYYTLFGTSFLPSLKVVWKFWTEPWPDFLLVFGRHVRIRFWSFENLKKIKIWKFWTFWICPDFLLIFVRHVRVKLMTSYKCGRTTLFRETFLKIHLFSQCNCTPSCSVCTSNIPRVSVKSIMYDTKVNFPKNSFTCLSIPI